MDSSRRPNVILVMSDDQGWGDVGYNGNRIIQTPHTDAMAVEGVKLNRFYAAAPVCSPTRGSCMTGRHPYRYGILWADNGFLPAEEITLAEALKTAGYATGHFGKWHMGTMTKTGIDATRGGERNPQLYSPPWENGFDECFTTESRVPTFNPLVWGAGKWEPDPESRRNFRQIMDRPVALGEKPDMKTIFPWHGAYWAGPGNKITEGLEGDDSAIIMDRALDFIGRNANDDTPLFAVIWFHTPHTPIAAGDSHRALYRDHPMEAQHFYGCITAMDEQVGRLRNELRNLGIADDTLLWYCSDNGPSYIHDYNSAGPFRGKKATLFEGGIRVPGIVEWPAVLTGGVEIDAPMVTSDFYPTILSALDIEIENQPILDGTDVMPILTGRQKERNTPICFQSAVRGADSDPTSERQLVLEGERYKILSMNNGRSYELYDLVEDPSETVDRAGDNPGIVEPMRAELETWVESCSRSLAGDDY